MQVTMTMEEYKELEGYKQKYISLTRDILPSNHFMMSGVVDEETIRSISEKLRKQLTGLRRPIV
ncbi:hypothetical protein EXN48_14470 [Clostridium botulinum]|nr:hypothetical protein [Clostridium botulinum]NFC90723.1 hypothetical protein [Clostridium botulinum]NFC99608.1 hypothetical protein [Clostridium botulinum]NFD38453.1 hypothetical protein [Clostridium botulinum]NFD42120.1 hypothetical protein [Clostridium botulinum]